MKKRVLSLAMCLLMIACAFVMGACGDKEDDLAQAGGDSNVVTTSSNTPMTIYIYSIKEEGTTDEAIELVEEALSKIAIRRYNTTIDLVLIDEKDYASQMFAKVRMAVNSYNTKRLEDKTLDKTEKDQIMKSNVDYQYVVSGDIRADYNIIQATNLPSDVLTGNLDIFLVYKPEAGNASLYKSGTTNTSLSMFDILYNEEALAPLKSYLDSNFSEVKAPIYAHALQYVTRPGYKTSTTSSTAAPDNIFGIPNNYIYGNYDYAIFNTTYVDKIFSGSDKQSYADSYKSFRGYNEETGVVTGSGKFTELVKELVEKQGQPGFEYDKVIKTFPSQGAYEAYLESNESFAIGLVTGDKSIETLFESHEHLDVYVTGRNDVTNPADYCDSMFCIGKPAMANNGERAKRCLQILDLMNNNREFRNILQYGVEGIHFTQYSDEVIPLESPNEESKYFMNMKYTGNMFILYTSSEMDEAMKLMSKNNWQLAKDQNVALVPANK